MGLGGDEAAPGQDSPDGGYRGHSGDGGVAGEVFGDGGCSGVVALTLQGFAQADDAFGGAGVCGHRECLAGVVVEPVPDFGVGV